MHPPLSPIHRLALTLFVVPLLLLGTLTPGFPEERVNPAFAPLEWLLGSWQGTFFPEGRSAPTMSFEWGDERRSWLRLAGTRPTPEGSVEPEHETMIVWHPVRERFVFQTSYFGGQVIEDGDIDLLPGSDQRVAVRMNMRVHYGAGATLPFSDGAVAGPEGHTLEFRRTFHADGPEGLRGVFLIKRGGSWEEPKLDVAAGDGFRWRRLPVPGLSQGGTQRDAVGIEGESLDSLSALEPLVGKWISSIDEKYRDHPMVRRFNPELKSQEMNIRWGVDRQLLHLDIFDLDRPSKGDRTLLVEGMALLNPATSVTELVEFNGEQELLLRGRYELQPNGDVYRLYEALFSGNERRSFREIWRFTDDSRSSFVWITEHLENGDWTSGGVEVVWTRQDA